MTLEHRAAISKALRGKQFTFKHRANLAAVHANRRNGRLLGLTNGYAKAYFLGRWEYAHRLAFTYYMGIYNVPYGRMVGRWVVHHVNGDKLDNCRENLELLTKGEHTRTHSIQ